MSQLRIAKIAGARRIVAERLTTAGCAFPDETARSVIDDLLKAGWVFPGWQLDDDVPQPSYSTPEGRRRARAIYEQARRDRADAIAAPEEESA